MQAGGKTAEELEREEEEEEDRREAATVAHVMGMMREILWLRESGPSSLPSSDTPSLGFRPFIVKQIQEEISRRLARLSPLPPSLPHSLAGHITELIYSSTWQYLRGLFSIAFFFAHKHRSHTPSSLPSSLPSSTTPSSLASSLLSFLLSLDSPWVPYTAGVRREGWVAQVRLHWMFLYARGKGEGEGCICLIRR